MPQIELIDKKIKIVITTKFDVVQKVKENVSIWRGSTKKDIPKKPTELLEMEKALNGISRLGIVEASNELENKTIEKID